MLSEIARPIPTPASGRTAPTSLPPWCPPRVERKAKFPIINQDVWAIDPDTGEHISGAGDQLQPWTSAIRGMDVDLGIKDPVVGIKGHGLGLTERFTDIAEDGDVIATFKITPRDLKAQVGGDQTLLDEIIRVMADGTAEMQVEITGEPQIGLQLGALPPGDGGSTVRV